jgi:hypothetical protein
MQIKSCSKMAENIQGHDKKRVFFLEGIVCKHLLVWGFLFNLLSLS